MIPWCINFSASYQLSMLYQLLHFFISILRTVCVATPQRTVRICIINSSVYRLRISTCALLRIRYSSHKVLISSFPYQLFRVSALVLTFLRINAPGLLRISVSVRISVPDHVSAPHLRCFAYQLFRIQGPYQVFCVSALLCISSCIDSSTYQRPHTYQRPRTMYQCPRSSTYQRLYTCQRPYTTYKCPRSSTYQRPQSFTYQRP